MSDAPTLHTDRLILRGWCDGDGDGHGEDDHKGDRDAFAALNADPDVMHHFPAPLTRAESDAFFDVMLHKWASDGMGWFAVTDKAGAFLGFAGLNRPRLTTHFTPCVEIGWRFARHAWRNGYATEAARTCLDWGFDTHELAEIVSFAVPANTRSWAVMQRIGMIRDGAGDFDHPAIAPDHPLCRHVLYRLDRQTWSQTRAQNGKVAPIRRAGDNGP